MSIEELIQKTGAEIVNNTMLLFSTNIKGAFACLIKMDDKYFMFKLGYHPDYGAVIKRYVLVETLKDIESSYKWFYDQEAKFI